LKNKEFTDEFLFALYTEIITLQFAKSLEIL